MGGWRNHCPSGAKCQPLTSIKEAERDDFCMSLATRIEERLHPVMKILEPIQGLSDMFARCFLSTLESTARQSESGGTYVITGDIEAMWLRDSTEQVLHYLRFAADDPELASWIERLIHQQMAFVLIDPYANAFNMEPSGRHGFEDVPKAGPWIWERKYELDSLSHVLLLALRYHQATGRTAFLDDSFFAGVEKILDVITVEQDHEACSPYHFERFDCPPSDTLIREGRGAPVQRTGMSWSGFRPSDDACEYGYLIPANLFAQAMLRELAPLAQASGRAGIAARALQLADQIQSGVQQYGIVEKEGFGSIYAYETDGMGRYCLMDDANVPSLLSLPYLGVCKADDPLYARTRAFVLSGQNPFYHAGSAARGIGSPHTPKDSIWPIALCVQGMTSAVPAERVEMLQMLLTTHAGTRRMHESFHKDNPADFTRSWFAWANSMFGELVMQMYERGELAQAVQQLLGNGIKDIK